LATEAQQLPQAQRQANGSQSVQSQEQAPPVSVPSPLPQQLQQYTMGAAARSKSPLPAPQQTQQPPMFPPGVKVTQAEQQSGTGTSQTPQNFAPLPSSQQVPQQRPSLPSTFPGSLSDLVVSFENVKQKGMGSFFLSLS